MKLTKDRRRHVRALAKKIAMAKDLVSGVRGLAFRMKAEVPASKKSCDVTMRRRGTKALLVFPDHGGVLELDGKRLHAALHMLGFTVVPGSLRLPVDPRRWKRSAR